LAVGVEPFLLWISLSLLAIAWIGTRPYVALVIAFLGGTAMGLSGMASYSASGEADLDRGARNLPTEKEE
jgi:hypothetical protein